MRPESMRGQPVNSGVPGPNKTPFCVHDDEWLWASDEFLRETGQTHHVVDTEAAPTQGSWVGGESTKVLDQWKYKSTWPMTLYIVCTHILQHRNVHFETEQKIVCYGRPMEQGRPLYFVLWFLLLSSFFFLLFPLAYSQPSHIGCLPYFHTWCGLSANLECRSEMCCMRLAKNTGHKIAKNSPSGHHRTILSGCVFAKKACIDNRKENLLKAISPPHVPITWRTSAH